MSNTLRFIKELRRRDVFRTGAAYLVAAWLLVQILDILLGAFDAPAWALRAIVVALAVGFPVALVLAWVYEITKHGVKRTEETSAGELISPHAGRQIDFVIIGVLLVAVVLFAADKFQWIDFGAETSVGPRSVAVLPFVNLSSDEEQEWFAVGLSEEILNSLARTPDLHVAARTSSFAFKGTNDDIRKIAEALDVDHILEGSVRRGGDTLRVTAQLIRASDGFHLWSETYDRKSENVIEVQETIAIDIANALETAMDPEALARMVSVGTASVPAFERYLEGQAFRAIGANTADPSAVPNARHAFEEAVRLDPTFARAHWRLAAFWQGQLGGTRTASGATELTPVQILSRYDNAATNAIEHAKDPVDRLGYRARKAYNNLQYRLAMDLSTRFLEQRPNDQYARGRYLDNLVILRKYDEIAQEIAGYHQRGELEDNAGLLNDSLQALSNSGHNELLRTISNTAIEHFSATAAILYQAHRALLWAGDIETAREVLNGILSGPISDQRRYLASLRQACAEGNLEEANRLFSSGTAKYAYRLSTVWLSYMFMDRKEEAAAALMPLDNGEILHPLASYLVYGPFDPTPFPNLMSMLEDQGITSLKVVEIPFRCKS
jgi:TolB-like protein